MGGGLHARTNVTKPQQISDFALLLFPILDLRLYSFWYNASDPLLQFEARSSVPPALAALTRYLYGKSISALAAATFPFPPNQPNQFAQLMPTRTYLAQAESNAENLPRSFSMPKDGPGTWDIRLLPPRQLRLPFPATQFILDSASLSTLASPRPHLFPCSKGGRDPVRPSADGTIDRPTPASIPSSDGRGKYEGSCFVILLEPSGRGKALERVGN